ncbi:hypothetical protein [Kocuria sp.]|uniref:DUF6414 family protein n=1 Tax=Kocuria sp. TaxID=1871328 RepID=UPI0026DFCA66|nr:hypothetical protein [Kocuria sp.]MDO5366850.1 hypothetical protein [Kocuria sp.]
MAPSKNRLTLAHPVYLDTPMLLSFIATMKDGVSLGSAVTENRAKNSSFDVSGHADGGTESILAILGLKVSATGELARTSEKEKSVEESFIRQHTVASLFSLLIQGLTEAEAVKINPDISDIENGDLIIFNAKITESPLEVALATIEGILPLMELGQPGQPAPSRNQQQSQKKKSPNHSNNNRSNEVMGIDAIKAIVEVIKQDQESSPVVDLVAYGERYAAILTADRTYFSAASRAAIVDGQFKVVGKVTAVFPDNTEEISVLRRGASAQLSGMTEIWTTLIDTFSSEVLRNPLPPVKIKGPLVQVLPLAIYI